MEPFIIETGANDEWKSKLFPVSLVLRLDRGFFLRLKFIKPRAGLFTGRFSGQAAHGLPDRDGP